MKGRCDGIVTRRWATSGKPYKLPCDKPATFTLATYADTNPLLEACRVHLPDLAAAMIRSGEQYGLRSVDVRMVTK